MNPRRLVLAAAGVSVSFALMTTGASACVDPDITLGPGTGPGATGGPGGTPGDVLGFSISHTDQGAHYTISIGGEIAVEGEDPGGEPGVEGSLVVPDLGSEASNPAVTVQVDHEGQIFTPAPHVTFAYAGTPVQAPPTTTPNEPPVTQTPPSGAPSEGAAGTTQPGFDDAGSSGSAGGDQGSREGRTDGAAQIQASNAEAAGSVPATSVQETAPIEITAGSRPEAEQTAGQDATGVQRGDRQQRASRSRSASVLPETSSEPTAASSARDVGTAEDVSSGVFPGLLLAMLIAVGVMLILVLRRSGPDEMATGATEHLWTPPSMSAEASWRSKLIEAELQEMIAEARARELLTSSREPTHSSPVGKASRSDDFLAAAHQETV